MPLSMVMYIIFRSNHVLKNNLGKFHMVEIFLQSAPKKALMEVLESENQNLWHVISSFSPFDR